MTPSVTFDQALAIARQLTPAERARLVAQLVTELATPQPPPGAPAAESSAAAAWGQLESFWEAIESLGPAAPSATEQLFEDRRTRQETLDGGDRVHA